MSKIRLFMLMISICLFVVVAGAQDESNHIAILVVDVFEENPISTDEYTHVLGMCGDDSECFEDAYGSLEEARTDNKNEIFRLIQKECIDGDNACRKSILTSNNIITELCNNDGNDSPDCVQPTEDCVVSLGGQDGMKWSGGTGEEFLTSSLRPQATHGNLVHSDLTYLLISQFVEMGETAEMSVPQVNVPGFDTPWLRNVETWKVDKGLSSDYISIIGIDTNGYSTSAVTSRVDEAIEILVSGQGFALPVDKFVINMSFSFIPCGDLPAADMSDIIYAWVASETKIGGVPEENLYTQLRESFLNDYAAIDEDGAEVVNDAFELGFEIVDSKGAYGPFWSEFKDSIDDDVLNVHYLSFFSLIADSNYDVIRDDVMEIVTLPRLSSALLSNFDQYDPTVVDFFSIFDFNSNHLDDVVFVASAGNDGLPVPYFPASSPEVLSVSASYPSIKIQSCEQAQDQEKVDHLSELVEEKMMDPLSMISGTLPESVINDAVDDILDSIDNPVSNSGEIIHNGISAIHKDNILGCLRGTSFAAPRVALETAVFYLDAVIMDGPNLTNCQPDAGFDHPLSYDGYDNLTRVEKADDKSCETFENVAIVP